MGYGTRRQRARGVNSCDTLKMDSGGSKTLLEEYRPKVCGMVSTQETCVTLGPVSCALKRCQTPNHHRWGIGINCTIT